MRAPAYFPAYSRVARRGPSFVLVSSRPARTVLAVVALSIGACAPPGPAPAAPSSVPETPSAAPAGSAETPHGRTLSRSAVRGMVSQGLGTFLQYIELDDKPVLAGGKFHGFRIAALRADFWSGVDLKPGDIVTRVNGFSIERPEQAQTAFESLGVASELRVSYERDGEPRELVYAIVDDH